MNADEAIERACQEPTLSCALSWIAVWETERAVAQALEWQRTGVSTASHGGGWDTCFEVLFRDVIATRKRPMIKPNDEAAVRVALQAFLDRMDKYGNWDDGCFYYAGRSASELQEPIRLARAVLPRPTAATGGGVEREALSAWFNNLPCDSLGKEHFDEMLAIIASTPSQAVKAEAGRPLAAGTREEIARIIDPRAFIIANSKRFEIKERQDAALAKADAIRALASAATRTGE